jgi:hypothetical protein
MDYPYKLIYYVHGDFRREYFIYYKSIEEAYREISVLKTQGMEGFHLYLITTNEVPIEESYQLGGVEIGGSGG